MNAENFYKPFMVTLHPNSSDIHSYYILSNIVIQRETEDFLGNKKYFSLSVTGRRFGMMQMKTGLVHILSHFEVAPCKDTPVPLKLHPKPFLMQPLEDIILTLKKRNKHWNEDCAGVSLQSIGFPAQIFQSPYRVLIEYTWSLKRTITSLLSRLPPSCSAPSHLQVNKR